VAAAPEEERVLDDDRGMRVGEVRELEEGSDVAGGEDPRVGGAQALVDLDPGLVVGDARRFEAEVLDVGRAADGDQVSSQTVSRRSPERSQTITRSPAPPRRTSTSLASSASSIESRTSASWTIFAASASSRISTCGATSKSVTREPKRAKAWASSQPIGPAPITAKRRGSSVRANTVSLVR
jgi:hypothetical protein